MCTFFLAYSPNHVHVDDQKFPDQFMHIQHKLDKKQWFYIFLTEDQAQLDFVYDQATTNKEYPYTYSDFGMFLNLIPD